MVTSRSWSWPGELRAPGGPAPLCKCPAGKPGLDSGPSCVGTRALHLHYPNSPCWTSQGHDSIAPAQSSREGSQTRLLREGSAAAASLGGVGKDTPLPAAGPTVPVIPTIRDKEPPHPATPITQRGRNRKRRFKGEGKRWEGTPIPPELHQVPVKLKVQMGGRTRGK